MVELNLYFVFRGGRVHPDEFYWTRLVFTCDGDIYQEAANGCLVWLPDRFDVVARRLAAGAPARLTRLSDLALLRL
jgi:hypothetical protein